MRGSDCGYVYLVYLVILRIIGVRDGRGCRFGRLGIGCLALDSSRSIPRCILRLFSGFLKLVCSGLPGRRRDS